jgi:hypothetical protein
MITLLIVLLICVICGFVFSDPADAYTGRRAVLYTRGQVMLAENAPYVWGKADCSMQAWNLLKDLWPELTLTKWFHRTTAEAMAGWPWPPVLRLNAAMFGDLLFANSEEYAPPGKIPLNPPLEKGEAVSPLSKGGSGGILKQRTSRADFQINHVLVHWDEILTAVHAGKKRGFSKTNLKPYWEPRITVIVRPPY